MKNPFTLSWSKPKVDADLPEYHEIPAGGTLDRLNSYSETVLNIVRKNIGPEAGYTEASIKYLSNSLSANRLKYVNEAKIKIANLYGCFLGTCIIETYKGYDGRWAKWNDDIGVLLSCSHGSLTKITFPITRAFRHIENGEKYSIYSLFVAIPEFVTSQPSR